MRLIISHQPVIGLRINHERAIKSLQQCLVIASTPFFMIGCMILFTVKALLKIGILPFILAGIISYMGYRYTRRHIKQLTHYKNSAIQLLAIA